MTKASNIPENLDAILQEAHLPALLMSLVHMTGNAEVLTDDMLPVYDFFGDSKLGGYSQPVQDALRANAAAAIKAYLTGQTPLPPEPGKATITKMMSLIAGGPVPEHYTPLLMEELGLEGLDSRIPEWPEASQNAAKAKLKVLIIGAGMSGILSAIRLQQAGVPFEIIEKNADFGGTWLENTYPGCRVDNPSHMYSYSFEPNHDWPMHYSTQDVLFDYFKRCADKHGLRPHVRFGTTVNEAIWDEAAMVWRLSVTRADGAVETLVGNALISAVGQLNQPRLPDIKGRDSFAGPSFHSARWRHDVELTGKRVIVVGTGASAFQFVPEIAPKVDELTVLQRTPPWLAPTPNYHDKVTPAEEWLLKTVPFYEKWYRFWLFWLGTDGILDAVTVDPNWTGPKTAVSQVNADTQAMMVEAMRVQTGGDETLLSKIVPQYPLGGKRTVRDNGVWIAALRRPNVNLVTEAISEITPEGVITADGKLHKADVIIYGTGFTASDFLRTFKLVGRGGVELHDQWAGDAKAYLGMTVPNFPNLFIVYGPNTNIVVNGSIIFFSECSVRYIVEAMKFLAETDHAAMEPIQAVFEDFNARVDVANAGMAWGVPQVSSWYKNATGRVSQNWPFRLIDYWTATMKPKPSDFLVS